MYSADKQIIEMKRQLFHDVIRELYGIIADQRNGHLSLALIKDGCPFLMDERLVMENIEYTSIANLSEAFILMSVCYNILCM